MEVAFGAEPMVNEQVAAGDDRMRLTIGQASEQLFLNGKDPDRAVNVRVGSKMESHDQRCSILPDARTIRPPEADSRFLFLAEGRMFM